MGMSRSAAAAKAGMAESSLNNWLNKKPEFARIVAEAEAEHEESLIRGLREAASNHCKNGFIQWQAGAWLLERRYPESWALRPNSKPQDSGVVINLILPGGQQQQLVIGSTSQSSLPLSDLPSTNPPK